MLPSHLGGELGIASFPVDQYMPPDVSKPLPTVRPDQLATAKRRALSAREVRILFVELLVDLVGVSRKQLDALEVGLGRCSRRTADGSYIDMTAETIANTRADLERYEVLLEQIGV